MVGASPATSSPSAAAGSTASPSRYRRLHAHRAVATAHRPAVPASPARWEPRTGRRCGSAPCSTAGTPTRPSTGPLCARACAGGRRGRRLVCLQELTLSPYFAIDPGGPAAAAPPRAAARRAHLRVRGRAGRRDRCLRARVAVRGAGRRRGDGLGFNTAICVAPDGALVARTRKLHIPVTAGYYEDQLLPARRQRLSRSSPSAAPRSASRPAGTSGSPSSPAPTRCAAPRCSSTPRRSVRARPPRLRHRAAVGAGDRGQRASPTARSWSPSTASAPRRRSRSTARRSSATPTAGCWCRRP